MQYCQINVDATREVARLVIDDTGPVGVEVEKY